MIGFQQAWRRIVEYPRRARRADFDVVHLPVNEQGFMAALCGVLVAGSGLGMIDITKKVFVVMTRAMALFSRALKLQTSPHDRLPRAPQRSFMREHVA